MATESEGARTRSKSKSLEYDIAVGVKDEVESFLKSEVFKEIVQSAVREAVNVCIERHVQPLSKMVASLEETVAKLEEVARLAIKANDNEQYSRRHNIRVSGFPEEKGEDCTDKIIKLFHEHLAESYITSEVIDRAHRVGKSRTDGKSRAIIVRFKSHRDKVWLMKARKELKGTPYFINDDLTRVNQKIYYTARTGCLNVSSVWTTGGRIFVKRQSDDKKFQIIKHSDFNDYGLI